MPNLDIQAILLYMVYVLLCSAVSLIAILLFIAFGYSGLQKIIEPSFDLKNGRRWVELSIAYLIFSFIFVATSETILKHFGITLQKGSQASVVFFPPILYLITRSTVRFISARIAKDFLLSILLIIIVGVSVMITFQIVGTIERFDYHVSVESIIILAIMGIPTVFIGDFVLFYLPIKIKFIGDHYIKDRRLIDLTDKLPVKMENIIGVDAIDEKITEILSKTVSSVKIITRTYTTVDKNILIFKKLADRRATGEDIDICIIGTKINDVKAFHSTAEQKRAELFLNKIKGLVSALHICQCTFDNIRLILRDSQEAMITFPTGNYEKSHVGLYSSHPLFISLLENYFDTKCKALPCTDDCNRHTQEETPCAVLSPEKEALKQAQVGRALA